MPVLNVKKLSKEYSGKELFRDISFELAPGERLAMIGRNGVGKTTLLHCLKGIETWEHGEIWRSQAPDHWGWLEQNLQPEKAAVTLLQFVQSSSPERYRLKQLLEQLQDQLSLHPQEEAILDEYGKLYDAYIQLDGYDWEVKVERSLQQMNLHSSLWSLPFNELSGGQKTKGQIAALLVREPEFIVLDEPTNHLDQETLLWLEGWLSSYPGTILYVSHDRTFIDHTATAVLELEPTGCRRYAGGYADYKAQKDLELRSQEMLYKKQEQEKQKLLESMRLYAEWFSQAHRAAGQNDFLRSKSKKNVSRMHAKEVALERLEKNRIEKPREAAKLHMRLEASEFSARTVLRLENISFNYDRHHEIFRDLSLFVQQGDRLAILGPNGTGKSTLVKLISGHLAPKEGSISVHPQTRIGYFAQELDSLNPEETLLDGLLSIPDMTESEARTLLGCFLFSKDDVFKRIGDLSMGEKCRAAFLKLLFGRANLLVLDEPTNYLDIATRERVEDALQHYSGAVILVTHDRYWLKRAANRLLVLGDHKTPVDYPGTYDEYYAEDRSKQATTGEQQIRNERKRLQLRLAYLMSLDLSREDQFDEDKDNASLMNEIMELSSILRDN